MLTGIYVPTYNDYSDPARLVELAVVAESAGFDGFFVYDHMAIEADGMLAVADATIVLGAAAQATTTLKLGPMITPLARRRPWKVAKELATLDHLSNGRVVFGVGLGEPAEVEFAAFNEDSSPKGRAARLDEGLGLLDKFLRGESVKHDGKHYRVNNITLLPSTFQKPRPPIWVAAALPARAGLRRAAHWEGCFPIKVPEAIRAGTFASTSWDQWWLSPEELADAAAVIANERGNLDGYALVATGSTADDGREAVSAKFADYSAAGANWWLEWIDDKPNSFDNSLEHIKRGPPNLAY